MKKLRTDITPEHFWNVLRIVLNRFIEYRESKVNTISKPNEEIRNLDKDCIFTLESLFETFDEENKVTITYDSFENDLSHNESLIKKNNELKVKIASLEKQLAIYEKSNKEKIKLAEKILEQYRTFPVDYNENQ